MTEEGLKETITTLEKHNKELQEELQKIKNKPQGDIAYMIITIGIILLAISIVHTNNISTFIGLALTFWGALLLYIKPNQYTRIEVLNSSINSLYENIQELISDLGYEGEPKYISTVTLGSFKKVYLYIPEHEESTMLTEEQLINNIIFYKEPPSIKILPPGLELAKLIELELKTHFSSINIEYLNNNLHKAIVEGLEMAKIFQMENDENKVQITIKDSIFNETILRNMNKKTLNKIGDPLISALGCILAITTKKPIKIYKNEYDPLNNIEKVVFQIL